MQSLTCVRLKKRKRFVENVDFVESVDNVDFVEKINVFNILSE